MGWFGLTEQLLYVLGTYGAQKTPDGAFEIYGEPIAVGLGGAECVVPDGAECVVKGQRVAVAGLMNGTSYGLRNVHVI